jgi:NAD(P)-dependent dehydrogenase (short-subunit alcohol dehydrogenase family)
VNLDGIAGRVALVTGGSRGIGREIALTLAANGARVAVGDLELAELPQVLPLRLDVTDESSVDAAFGAVESHLGPVELLVLNAGIFFIEPFDEATLDSWRRTMSVNLDGVFLCARRAIPSMKEAGFGRIVAVGSSAGKTGGAKAVAAYAASKAGTMALMKSLASEFARDGIRANAVAPALIDTQMISAMPDMRDKVPIGRLGTPVDVAAVVAFLLSDHADFITGEVVDVNGGFLID